MLLEFDGTTTALWTLVSIFVWVYEEEETTIFLTLQNVQTDRKNTSIPLTASEQLNKLEYDAAELQYVFDGEICGEVGGRR